MRTCVLIPSFNAEKSLGSLLEKIAQYVNKKDTVVIDDGSRDNTSTIALEKGVTLLRHSVNRGKGEALKTGFQYALNSDYQAVITIDADGQHDPELLPHLLKVRDYDIVIGSRMRHRKNMPFMRVLSNKITSLLISIITGQKIEDSQSGYRIIKAQVLRNITLITSHYETESELLIKAIRKGYSVGFCDINTVYADEKTSINPLLDILRFVKLIVKTILRIDSDG